MIDLSVVIVNYNTRELLLQCVASVYDDLMHGSANVAAEVLVVDNASSDGSVAALHDTFPQTTVIESGRNAGYGAGANIGLLAAGGRYLLLLNSDTVVLTGTLRELVAFMEQHPDAGVVGPRLLNADGTVQRSAFRFPGLAQVALDLFPIIPRLTDTRLNGRYDEDAAANQQPFQPDFVLGAAMCVRREVIEQTGGFDESFFMYAEEVDWQRRMRAAGWRVYSLPAARIIHHAGQSTKQQPGRMFVELHRSRALYYRKHKSAAFQIVARLLTKTAMLWNALADWAHALRGDISAGELKQRWRIYGQVFRLK